MDSRLQLAIVPLGLLLGALGTWFLLLERPTTQQMPVDGSGMVPSYPAWSDALPVQSEVWLAAADVSRGDVLVYESRANDRFCLARVIGTPGDAVSVTGTGVTIDGTRVPHTPSATEDDLVVFQETHGSSSYTVRYTAGGLPPTHLTVAPNDLYVLGDDRTDRRESCFGGRLRFSRVAGRVP